MRIAGTCSEAHAIDSGRPLKTTRTTGLPVATTASRSLSWFPGRPRSGPRGGLARAVGRSPPAPARPRRRFLGGLDRLGEPGIRRAGLRPCPGRRTSASARAPRARTARCAASPCRARPGLARPASRACPRRCPPSGPIRAILRPRRGREGKQGRAPDPPVLEEHERLLRRLARERLAPRGLRVRSRRIRPHRGGRRGRART